MSRKLALKKLKASDLSFFQTYLTRNPQTKQKGFNLDRAVIERTLFPSLAAEIEAAPDRRAGVALTFFGPGAAPAHLLMRKVLKEQKNWRLNGEAVHNPDNSPDRYDTLGPEDIAVMEFTGAGIPTAVKVVLLSATDPRDALAHAALASAFPGPSMTALTETELEAAIATSGAPPDHPIRDWLDRDLIEDVGQGGGEAAAQLFRRRQGRAFSAAELKKARESAEAVGRLGEELLDYHFEAVVGTAFASYEWVASTNAISPFDFVLRYTDGAERHCDAKSTAGPFTNPIHLSLAEIQHAVSTGVPYDVYRLYEVTESGGRLRIARDIATKLASVVSALGALPPEARVDSLSFTPDFFQFEAAETAIAFPDEAP